MQRSPAGGFTLIEVLVAMFVLAVGVIGAAATQAASARLRQQAALESEAVALASSLAARIGVNPAQMALPDPANPYLQLDYDAAGGAPADPPVQCFGSAACDSAQLAQFDIHELARSVQEGFPGGRITVCRDAPALNAALDWPCTGGSDAPLVVKIGWRRHTTAAPAPHEATPFVVMVVSG
ncbi:type IV pilus modification protein PilV [Massilia niabensis]|uniref:Type IV pilus modification protein PilV n=1 Tax=Massilia niabensis TaxID=544910 RepID=A0ABW0L0M7_9BURK